MTVTNSTISGNTAGGSAGGGIIAAGAVTVTNSTISGNTANPIAGSGGGIVASGLLTLVYATVVANTAPTNSNVGGQGTGSLTSFGSVVALPQGGGTNCGPLVSTTSNGFNFSDDATCGFTAATDKQNGGDPKLGPLANNGGERRPAYPSRAARSSTPSPSVLSGRRRLGHHHRPARPAPAQPARWGL